MGIGIRIANEDETRIEENKRRVCIHYGVKNIKDKKNEKVGATIEESFGCCGIRGSSINNKTIPRSPA